MNSKNVKFFFRCLGISLLICLTGVFILFLITVIHSIKAPFILLTNSQLLGRKLGTVDIQWNGQKKSCWLYTSKKFVFGRGVDTVPCLLIYPKFRWNPLPNHALKITENSIGIFNDGITECFPMGKWIYESDMTYPVYSVDNDMKGWAAKYEIIKNGQEVKYKVYPSRYSDRNIEFSIPVSYFEKIKF